MKQNTTDKTAERAGAADFLKFIRDGQPEWAIAAIKAPKDEVSDELVDFRGASSLNRDVAVKEGKEYDEIEPFVAVVQIKGNPWTLIYRSLGYVDERQIEAASEDAKELSARLNTRAISFAGEDTSGANQYELFEKGKVLEQAEWVVGGELFRFKSTHRKRPDLEKVTDEFVDGLFREEGAYLPACYPMTDADNPWLAVEKGSADAVERADLIELETDEEDDDYEEEEDV